MYLNIFITVEITYQWQEIYWTLTGKYLTCGYFSILNRYLLSINMYLPKCLHLILKPGPNGLVLLLLKQLNRSTNHGTLIKLPVVKVTMSPTLQKETSQLLLLEGQNLILNLSLLIVLNKILTICVLKYVRESAKVCHDIRCVWNRIDCLLPLIRIQLNV